MEYYYDGNLVMPSNFVAINNDEMEYVEGGAKSWWNSRGFVAAAIDIAIIVITTGKSLLTLSALKAFLKANKNKLLYQVRGKIVKMFGSAAGYLVGSALNIALTIGGSSIGGMIAAGIDYADGNFNGYCFG